MHSNCSYFRGVYDTYPWGFFYILYVQYCNVLGKPGKQNDVFVTWMEASEGLFQSERWRGTDSKIFMVYYCIYVVFYATVYVVALW